MTLSRRTFSADAQLRAHIRNYKWCNFVLLTWVSRHNKSANYWHCHSHSERKQSEAERLISKSFPRQTCEDKNQLFLSLWSGPTQIQLFYSFHVPHLIVPDAGVEIKYGAVRNFHERANNLRMTREKQASEGNFQRWLTDVNAHRCAQPNKKVYSDN